MAKKLYADARVPFVRWATTRAEDYLIIDAILKVRRFIQPSDVEFMNFEDKYFDKGVAIKDHHMMILNSRLRRKGLEQILLVEGHSDSYTIIRDQTKSEARAQIREQLEALPESARATVIERYRREVEQQDPRDLERDSLQILGNGTPTSTKSFESVSLMPTKLGEQLSNLMANGRKNPPKAAPQLVQPDPTAKPAEVMELEPETGMESDGDAAPSLDELDRLFQAREKKRKTVPMEDFMKLHEAVQIFRREMEDTTGSLDTKLRDLHDASTAAKTAYDEAMAGFDLAMETAKRTQTAFEELQRDFTEVKSANTEMRSANEAMRLEITALKTMIRKYLVENA